VAGSGLHRSPARAEMTVPADRTSAWRSYNVAGPESENHLVRSWPHTDRLWPLSRHDTKVEGHVRSDTFGAR
jgi:hypothetical protein